MVLEPQRFRPVLCLSITRGDPVGEGKLMLDKDYAVMTEKWRLVGGELYDIKWDMSQHNDVASEHPEVVGRLNVGDFDKTVPVKSADKKVVFDVNDGNYQLKWS